MQERSKTLHHFLKKFPIGSQDIMNPVIETPATVIIMSAI